MATVLCPSLVALDPVPCNDPSCSASHTHTPAFCDPCKAVHAQVHSSIHLASVGHRLRVEGPVAPVRCIVCCPLGQEPTAQFLFVGPEHYAVHARTSAHRARLSKLKPEPSVGMGRPSFDRPYASRASTSMVPPRSMTSPGPGSRPSSSMSFDGGAANAPPGPSPHRLADTEYVLCALCHTVLPVPPVDLAFLREHGKPTNRVVSHSSDATVKDSRPRRRIKDDEDETSTVLTTTDPQAEIETRKSLVLAHHNAHDTEHARRLRFPRFKEAWERRMKKQGTLDGTPDPEPEDEEEQVEPEQPPSRAILSPGQIAASPSQLSLSSLSASPSVAVMGLDGEDVYATYGRALKAFEARSAVGITAPPPPPPPPKKRDDDDESIVDWESRLRSSESPPQASFQLPPRAPSSQAHSVSSASTTFSYDSMGRRYVRGENGRAYRVDADGRMIMNGASVPVQIPSNLLPSLSPMTHSTDLDSEPDKLSLDERGFREPGPPPALPGKTTSRFSEPGPPPPLPRAGSRTSSPAPGVVKPRTSSPLPPSAPAAKFSPAAKPMPFNHPPPPRPPSAPIPRRSVSVSSTGQSQPYMPSPSPPPRLAFDTYGRVLKLGMLGWERDSSGVLQLGPQSNEGSALTSSAPPSTSSVVAPSAPASETSSQPSVQEEEEEEQPPSPPRSPTPEPEPERSRAPSPIGTEVGVPRGVATVLAPQRYTLIPGRSETSSTPATSPPPSVGSHTRSSSSMSMRSSSQMGFTGAGSSFGAAASSQLGFSGSANSQLGFGGATLNFGTGLEKGLVSGLGLETVPSHLASTLGGSISRPAHGRSASASVRSSSAQPSFRTPEPPVRSFSVSQPVRTTILPARVEREVPSSTAATGNGQAQSSGAVTAGYTPPSLYQSTGPTTRSIRPVVARKSTGEWARLEGKEGEGVAVGAGVSGPAAGGWKNRTQTPEVLPEEDSESGSESEGGDKSHSEASQLIREFSGKAPKPAEAPKVVEVPKAVAEAPKPAVDAPKPTVGAHKVTVGASRAPVGNSNGNGNGHARVISRTSTLPSRTTARAISSSPTPMPAPARNPSSSSILGNESIYATTSRRTFGPSGAEPTRAFSPSAAWSSLAPASPRSQSTQSEVDEFGSFDGPGLDQNVEVQPFDEKQFLADLGFGITIPPPKVRGPPSPSEEGSPVYERGGSQGKGKSPASAKTWSPASAKGKSPGRVQDVKGKGRAVVPSDDEEEGDETQGEESLPPSPVKRRASAPFVGTTTTRRQISLGPRQSLPTSIPAPVSAPAPARAETPPPVTPVRAIPQSSPPEQPTRRVTIRAPEPVLKSTGPIAQPLPAPSNPSTPAPKPSTPVDKPSTPVDKPSKFGFNSSTPISRPSPLTRGSTIRARAPSPLQREVQTAPPPPPPPAMTPVPAHIASNLRYPIPQTPESPAQPQASASSKPVLKTRRRARPMGSSVAGSVVSGYGRYAGSVVSGYEREGSVISGYDGGSVVSGYDDDRSVVSERVDDRSVVSERMDDKSVVSEREDAESEVGAPHPLVTLPPSLQLRALELMSPSSDAPSSIVTPLSPHMIQVLQSQGINVDEPISEESDRSMEAIAQHIVGMNLHETLGSPEPIGIEIFGRVDSGSELTSPVAPPGAPSDAGSLFSRVASPKPVPAVARLTLAPRLSMIRSETPGSTRTKTPPVTPPKATHVSPPKASDITPPKNSHIVTPPKGPLFARGLDSTPKSQRSARPESFAAPAHPESPPDDTSRDKPRGPSSIFSRGPESSYSSHEEKPKVEWKLELPQSSDPFTFQSFLGGMESQGHSHFGLDSAAMRVAENPNVEPDSEPPTPTSSAPRVSERPLRGPLPQQQQDANEEEEYDEVDPEEAEGEEDDGVEEDADEDGRLTSSDEGARTETADDDGLDHLTESIGEPFGLQAQADTPPNMEQSFESNRAQNGGMLGSGPLYSSPRVVSPPPLPEGFDTQFIDHRTPEAQAPMTPNEMEVFQTYGGEMAMPEEVLALQPIMCDACRAPMAASKWYEHISRSAHRRNAAHYAQWKFDHLTARYPDVDSRELWAQATRLDPRGALPTEYAFCEVCQVFLIRGDTDHFDGKKHLKCLKAIALRDADELESVRGSVSEEEDAPPHRPPMLASQRGVDWTQPRARSTVGARSALGHRAFPSGR
ncbi:proteophosphoglycan ppg4 [Rhizoctonia solani]|uniref:Proteophosphoglycan ppg4 n=1 Tax=Rhizoctonia solani TaxID=456999 RepID=A0A8H8P4F0_9AGAM|nr:proteophosphoglycan ppg4 [Rhizoctonia solani]QRW25045.1 proteophosphoglycan ppg4 [Rhizoctonia solani]